MGSIFSSLFYTFSPSSSSKTASLGTDDHHHEISSNKKMKINVTDSKGRDDGDLCSSKGWNGSSAAKRLRKEFQDITKDLDPPSHCSGGPVSTDDCDIFNWRGAIFGPDGTPFEGGVFFVSIRFRENYPFKPPSIKFITKIFHPNVDKFGNIHLDILREQWRPALTLTKVLLSICSFLDDPNVDEAANPIATIYRDDRQKYDKITRAWTRKYAMG